MRTLTCHPSVEHIFAPLAEHFGLGFALDPDIDPDEQRIEGDGVLLTINWGDVKV